MWRSLLEDWSKREEEITAEQTKREEEIAAERAKREEERVARERKVKNQMDVMQMHRRG